MSEESRRFFFEVAQPTIKRLAEQDAQEMARKKKAKLPKELKNHLENFRQSSGKPTSKRKTTVNFKKNY